MTLEYAEFEIDVRMISKEIGAPDNFLIGLLSENDWSFVIMLHAFMEALITNAISEALCRKELTDVLSHIEMSNVKTGKVAIAKALHLIDDGGKRFLSKLSSLRNSLVHDIKHIGFDLPKYLSSLDTNQRREFIGAFSYWASDEDQECTIAFVQDFARHDPKYAIWVCAMYFTRGMLGHRNNEKMKTYIQAMRAEIARASTEQDIV